MSDSEENGNFVEQIINSESNSNSENSESDDEPIEYNLNLTQLNGGFFDVESQLNANIWTQTISGSDLLSDESAEEITTDYNNNTENSASNQSNPISITHNYQENISSLITSSTLMSPIDTNVNNFSNISIPDILGNTTQSNTIFFPNTPPTPPPVYTVVEPPEDNQNNSQYTMLHNDDLDNPFSKCNIDKLDYETDDETTDHLRVIFFWNYEINYEYFNMSNLQIFHTKNELFKSQLNELKNSRNNSTNNFTGKIFKLNNVKNFKANEIVSIYLIAYYDNVKTDIELYGIYNQDIDESKLIDNIKRESTYGVNGEIINTNITNLGCNDFIVIHRKVQIF